MTAQIPGLTGEQISALEMLAGYPNGCAESELKAKDFAIGPLGGLIRAGLATATPGIRRPDARRGETGDHGEGAVNDHLRLWIGCCRASAPLRPSLTPRPPAKRKPRGSGAIMGNAIRPRTGVRAQVTYHSQNPFLIGAPIVRTSALKKRSIDDRRRNPDDPGAG